MVHFPRGGPDAELHICPVCAGELVQPIDRHEAGPGHWELARRCPSCEWRGSGVHDQAQVDRFDERTDQAIDAVLQDVRRLTRANMEDELLRFRRALGADHIGAEDFRAP